MAELTYAQRDSLAQELGAIVNHYFNDTGYGRCVPTVTFSEHDLKHYTFKMSCQTRGTSARYVLRYEKRNDLNAFKKEVKDCLKQHGFKSVKFDIPSQKCSYISCYGMQATEAEKVLAGVYVDW